MLLVVFLFLIVENCWSCSTRLSLLSLAIPDHLNVHQAVGVVGTVAATGVAIIIILHPHTVEGIDELVVILLVLKDILVVDASHHHVEYPRT